MTNQDVLPHGSWVSKILNLTFLTGMTQQPSRPLTLSVKEIRRLRELPIFSSTSTQIGGRNLLIPDPYWFIHCYQELWVNEIYRFRTKSSTPYILDCGANIGLSVIYFKYLYPNACIVAFEPDPKIYQVLELNTRSFELDNITLHQKAVWSSESTAAFAPDGSVGGRLIDTGYSKNTIEVQAIRLRDWLDVPVDLLKIDIEGAEYEVLSDCRHNLENVAHLFVEYHGKPDDPQRLHEILAILERAGFRYHIMDAYPIKHPFIWEERHSMYDLQSNIFAFRA